MSLNNLVLLGLNTLALGALLFLVASGLAMIFGLMRIVNVAHGSFYMLGAYLTLELLRRTGDQIAAAVLAVAAIAILGGMMQRLLIERLANNSLHQILLTFGFLLIISDVALFMWQGVSVILPTPSALAGSVAIGNARFPVYRIFVIVVGFVTAAILDLVQRRTRIGAMIRAGADDIEMLSCMGVNVRRLFVFVFSVGAGLAALGGALGGVYLGVYPGIDLEICILAFVVVIVGGLGSFRGTMAASLLVALIGNLANAFLPQLSMFAISLLMVGVIVIRPSGLFGRRAVA